MSEATSNNRFARLLAGYFKKDWSGALLAVVILAIAIELVTDGKPFFHPSNLMTILNNSAALGVIAGGMTLVILTAGIDLSVGSVMGMIAALVGYVASYWGFPPILAILFGMALGLGIGLIHGSLVARFGMSAFIVTLAGLSIWRGTGHLTTGAQATPKLDSVFDFFGRYNPFMPFARRSVMARCQLVDATWQLGRRQLGSLFPHLPDVARDLHFVFHCAGSGGQAHQIRPLHLRDRLERTGLTPSRYRRAPL